MTDLYQAPTAAVLDAKLAEAQTRLAELEGELAALKIQLGNPDTDVKGLAKLYQALTGEMLVWKERATALLLAKPASITADHLREVQQLAANLEALKAKRKAIKAFRQTAEKFAQSVYELENEGGRAESALRREWDTLTTTLRREGVSVGDIETIARQVF